MIAYAQSETGKFYVDKSKKELLALGISDVSIFNLKEAYFKNSREYDLIYVCGGNTFAILDRMRKTNIDTFIVDSIKNNRSVYLGVSAGSIIAGPDITIAGWGSEGDKNDVGLKDLQGLGLTSVAIFPHFKKHLQSEVNEFRNKVNYPVIELTDNEAVLVENSEYRIVR